MLRLLLVGAGGFIGSVLRYSMSGFVHKLIKNSFFPYGTLTVNILGCFIIGFLNGIAESKGLFVSDTRLFVFVGILGGFTTFSTFGYESFSLLKDAQFLPAVANILIQVIIGLFAVYCGDFISRLL